MLKRKASISLRLSLWFGCALFAGWIVFGVLMWANLRHTLTNERHQTLARRLDRLQDLLQRDQAAPKGDREGDFADFAHATGNGLMEIFFADGSRAMPSPSSAAKNFAWPAVSPASDAVFTTRVSGGQTYWVLARPYILADGRYILMAAAPDAGNALVMRNFLYGLLTWCPLLLVVSSVGGYWLSRRALEPVDSITAAARSISIGHLGDRVPVPDSGDELQRLAETCNAMLDRLQASVAQIKRFTADASHELRGPLSFARTVAEVCLRSPGTDPDSRTAFADIVQEMSTAAVLLEDMLTLARADALPASVEKKPVDLAIVLREACAMAEPIASQRGLSLRLELPTDAAPVLGDATFLRRMVWTLLDNAIKYSRDGGSIRVRLSLVDGEPKIDVRDDGIGILPEHLPFIFDRFYRADPSRAAVEGSGLGLAIAKWTAEAHGASLRAVSTPGVETLFTVDWSHSVARQAESYRRPT